MSTEVVKELFRNLEHVLHDRLKVIEDILNTVKPSVSSGSQEEFAKLQRHLDSLEEYAMGQIRTLAFNHDELEKRVISLESSMKSAVESFHVINETIEMLQQRMETAAEEKPVEAAEVEAEIDAAQEAALHAEVDPVSADKKAQQVMTKVVNELPSEEEVEADDEAEEEVEEEVEETEELELEEFEYKKKTYYRDQHSNVYIADEDGCVDPNQVVGIWNPKTKKIERVPSA